MRKNVIFYLIAFALLLIVSLFFGKAYLELVDYTAITHRQNMAFSYFQSLAKQINNAAISNPELASASAPLKEGDLFFADSLSVIKQLNLLETTVRDPVNVAIAHALDSVVKAELSWLLQSNVPDSIIYHKASVHIAALQSIDALIEAGEKRKIVLLAIGKKQLDGIIYRVIAWMIVFVVLSAGLLIYTMRSFFKQKAQTVQQEIEIEKASREISDYKYAIDESSIVAITDQKGIITYVNDNFCKISKYSREELIGHDHRIINSGYHSTQFIRNLWVTIASGKIWKGELKNKAKDGTIYWVDTTIVPFLNKERKPYQYIAIRADITQRKKAELEIIALNQSLEQKVGERTMELEAANIELRFLANIADNIQDPVITTDNNGIITRWNQRAEKLLGWRSEEVIGRITEEVLGNVYPYETREQIVDSYTKNGFWQGEIISRSKTQKALNLLVTSSKLKDASGIITGNLILLRDITNRVKAEAELKEYMYFFNNSNDLSCIANTEGRFEIINPSFSKVLGYLANELSQNPFIHFIHPDDMAATLQAYAQLKSGATVINFINRYRKKDGTYLWFDWNATPNPVTGKIYCIARDISERKKVEDQLQTANKELEAFSYSVSHDLRAPLRAINGFAKILEGDYGSQLDSEGIRLLGTITRNATKMGNLIDDLLAFSRLGRKELSKTLVDMNRLVQTALDDINQIAPCKAQIKINPLLAVKGDSVLLAHVIANLLSNAIKYSSTVDKPLIEISSEQKGAGIIYSFKDNGVGFDMQYADKLFGVFQRLHSSAKFEGTGVGLAIVKRIIDKHGGQVWAEAKLNQGAVFYFSLPYYKPDK